MLDRGGPAVFFLHQAGLLQHLARVAEKLLAFGRQRGALVGAPKDRDAQLPLQLPDGDGQAGLREKQLLGGLAERAGSGGGHHVVQLMQGHARPSVSVKTSCPSHSSRRNCRAAGLGERRVSRIRAICRRGMVSTKST